MKLRIQDIMAEAREISFLEPEAEINRLLGLGATREYRLEGPVGVVLEHYRAGTELFLAGEIKAATVAQCARCAEEFVGPNHRSFHYVLAPRSIGYDKKADLSAEDLEFSLYDGEDVDLTPLILEQTLLALPTRPLCREDCRGLCPQCGVNRNDHQCACASPASDPRLTVLSSLKLRRPN